MKSDKGVTKSGSSTKKATLRDRKKAQPNAVFYFSESEKNAIKDIVAKKLNDEQTKLFFYTCQALGLNPLVNEICAVPYKDKFGNSTMSIQVMRDGFLTIAHRSGKFAGMKSGVNIDEKNNIVSGWAEVYHKDFTVPLYQEADFEEYNAPTRNPLWSSKPKTMIKKVAESMALRKAFNVNGVYAPEEMDKEIPVVSQNVAPTVSDGDSKATEMQIKTIQSLDPTYSDESLESITKQEAVEIIHNLTK